MVALVPSSEGQLEVWGALAASAFQKEVDEEDRVEQHRSRGEAWGEEGLSYQEAPGDLRDTERVTSWNQM